MSRKCGTAMLQPILCSTCFGRWYGSLARQGWPRRFTATDFAQDIPSRLTRDCPNYLLLRTAEHETDDHGKLIDPEFSDEEGEKEFETASGAPPWMEDDTWFSRTIAMEQEEARARVSNADGSTGCPDNLKGDSEYSDDEDGTGKIDPRTIMKVIYSMGVGRRDD
jgi:hypothetical protein